MSPEYSYEDLYSMADRETFGQFFDSQIGTYRGRLVRFDPRGKRFFQADTGYWYEQFNPEVEKTHANRRDKELVPCQ